MIIDIGKHCGFALQSLNALIPIAAKAGIMSDPDDAYDEWETLVQAVFEAFIVIPICDETGKYSPSQFHRLGFDPIGGKIAITFKIEHHTFFLYDLVKNKNGVSAFEAKIMPLDQATSSKVVSIDECSNFAISKI